MEQVTSVNVQETNAVKTLKERKAEAAKKFAERKAEAAKKFAERRNAEKADRQKKATSFLKFLKDKKIQVPQDYTDLLNDLAVPVKPAKGSISDLFGVDCKVGSSITLGDYIRKTLNGRRELNNKVKQWEKKGIKITVTKDNDNELNTKYTIAAL